MILRQKLPKHVQNYLEAFGYDESSKILCEVCGRLAVDIHHVVFRSKFGRNNKVAQDSIENLVAVCRRCHDDAHGPRQEYMRGMLKEIIRKRKICI